MIKRDTIWRWGGGRRGGGQSVMEREEIDGNGDAAEVGRRQ